MEKREVTVTESASHSSAFHTMYEGGQWKRRVAAFEESPFRFTS